MSHTTIVSSATFYVTLLLLLVLLDFIQIEYVKIGVDNLHEIPKVNIYVCVQVLTLKMIVVIVFFLSLFCHVFLFAYFSYQQQRYYSCHFQDFWHCSTHFQENGFCFRISHLSCLHLSSFFIRFLPRCAHTHTHTVSFFYSTKWK